MAQNVTPLISVILPVYNGEKYLSDSIQSILDQSFENFELIILNDGSTDRTESIIENFDDPRIRYIRNESNIGLIDTLNKGLDLAIAPFIARMDGDDIAEKDRFQNQLDFLVAHSHVAVCGTGYFFWTGDTQTEKYFPVDSGEIKITLLFRSVLAHPTVMIRKESLGNIRYEKEFPSAEDYRLWTQLAKDHNMANLRQPLLKYRVHEQQITQSKIEEKEESLKRIMNEYLSYFGINADQNEINLQYRLSGGRGCRTREELSATEKWLLKIQAALVEKNYNPITIQKVLGKEWKKACENSGLGNTALQVHNGSSLKARMTINERFRFMFKIMSRYKSH